MYPNELFFGIHLYGVMIAIGIFVDDLYQIEAIFLYILFAAIQVIVLVPPLPPRVIIYFPIIYCDILFSNIIFSISIMQYISYLDLFFFKSLVLLLMVVG